MQIIVEDGKGRPDANSFVPLEKLTFYRDYYGFRIPEAEADQVELLLRAAADISGRQWKGRKANPEQAMAWPRRDCKIEYQTLSETFVPFELEWGQVRLAVELYAAEQDAVRRLPGHARSLDSPIKHRIQTKPPNGRFFIACKAGRPNPRGAPSGRRKPD